MKRNARGFTLLEVLVAVTVLAVALGAIIGSMTQQTQQAADMRTRTVALWVAHNRLTEIQLAPRWPNTGRSNGDVELGGVEWRWEAVVSETEDPELRRVDIGVRLRERDTDLADLSAFISRSGRGS